MLDDRRVITAYRSPVIIESCCRMSPLTPADSYLKFSSKSPQQERDPVTEESSQGDVFDGRAIPNDTGNQSLRHLNKIF